MRKLEPRRFGQSAETLMAELEQAHVLLENAHEELASVVQERDHLAASLVVERRMRHRLEATAAELTKAHRSQTASAEALRALVEQLRLLSEHLEIANEQLARSNHELEERVTQRTAALHATNQELAQLNANLNRRVQQETEARALAQSQLFVAQKLEAIGQLTGGIAHDFNNLLTVITGGLQLLSTAPSPDQRARLVKRIEGAAWRGADLTRRLLAFARRQPLNPQPLDVVGDISGLAELMRHGLKADITLETEFAESTWPAHADAAALELALLNLAVNARDAMPNGGRLVLGACNVSVPHAQPDLAAGDYVELRVADTGYGMTQETISRVFEPFFTTKEPGKGTGLGLAQVYGFARQSGGTARVESQPDKGTTVFMLLPRATRQPVPISERNLSDKMPAAPVENLAILVVEDDEDVAESVVEMLRQLGHRPTRVASVPAALAALAGKEAVDLIFSDVLLPGGGSGLDLAREVMQRPRLVPIILTSGFGGGMTSRLAASNLPFLRKPYTIERLRDVIGKAVVGRPDG